MGLMIVAVIIMFLIKPVLLLWIAAVSVIGAIVSMIYWAYNPNAKRDEISRRRIMNAIKRRR
jgi:hypothetical protein